VAACIDRLVRLGSEGIQTAQAAADLVKYASAAGALTTLAPGAIAAQPTHAAVMSFLADRSS
jgi:fructokinase